jgi:hypothetical protein
MPGNRPVPLGSLDLAWVQRCAAREPEALIPLDFSFCEIGGRMGCSEQTAPGRWSRVMLTDPYARPTLAEQARSGYLADDVRGNPVPIGG